MNKKILSVVIVLILVSLGAYLGIKYLKPETSQSSSGFISKDQIIDSDVVIRQTPEGYEPADITVKKGVRVVWLNETGTFAWPASNLHPTHNIYPEFDPREPVANGSAWYFVFDESGAWEFHDHLKPNRRGKVVVE